MFYQSFNHCLTGQKFSCRPMAMVTTALIVGSLLATAIAPVEAKPRYQRYDLNSRQGYGRVSNPYPYAPRADYRVSQQFDRAGLELPRDTLIPVTYGQDKKITLKKGETRSLTLRTAEDLRQRDGQVVVAAGSEIVGQFRPTPDGEGLQFIAQQLILRNGQYFNINAQSRELVGFQTQNQASTSDIVTGTLAGAGTATVIAGTTGDRRIDALEVLGGAAVGALAGWGLPTAGILGGGGDDVLTIDPSQDLTLMLQSPLQIDARLAEEANYNPRRSQNQSQREW